MHLTPPDTIEHYRTDTIEDIRLRIIAVFQKITPEMYRLWLAQNIQGIEQLI